MDWTTFFAKFLGLYLLIIVAIWLTRKNFFEKGIRDAISSDGTFALSGAINILMGLTIAILHPVWTLDWKVLITLLAYLSLIQGIVRLAFPLESRKIILKSIEKGYFIWPALAGVLGLILTYNGFALKADGNFFRLFQLA